jgi:hypothetical protein
MQSFARSFATFPALVFASLVSAGLAHADPATDALAEVAKCADIADSSERLKCFDKASPLVKNALVPAPKAAEKRGILDWFGFSKPTPPQTAAEYGKPAPPPEAAEVTGITATVLEYARTPRGLSVFILENGQIWRQLEGDLSKVNDPAPGTPMKVTIENGFLGSYNLTIEGRNGLIKVTRLK